MDRILRGARRLPPWRIVVYLAILAVASCGLVLLGEDLAYGLML